MTNTTILQMVCAISEETVYFIQPFLKYLLSNYYVLSVFVNRPTENMPTFVE